MGAKQKQNALWTQRPQFPEGTEELNELLVQLMTGGPYKGQHLTQIQGFVCNDKITTTDGYAWQAAYTFVREGQVISIAIPFPHNARDGIELDRSIAVYCSRTVSNLIIMDLIDDLLTVFENVVAQGK